MKPVLIVQHGEEAGPGYFADYLNVKKMRHTTVRTFAGEAIPRSASEFSGICLLGGVMSANDDLPWIDPQLALISDADACGIPVIGHCLGGQLLAKAFGAPVTVNSVKEIGWGEVQVDDAERARPWVGDGMTFELFQWHGDTFAIPSDGRRFLTSKLCANQAFAIERDGFVHVGMQFHVEMTPELVRSWVTHPAGIEEIDQAFERQNGVGVQRPEEMLRDVHQRTQRMQLIANRIYDRWYRGVRR